MTLCLTPAPGGKNISQQELADIINVHYSHESRRINLQFIEPGRPMQNAYIERKNGSMRRELLNAYLFTSLKEERELSEEWRLDYAARHGESVALSTPVRANPPKIAAQLVVYKAVQNEKRTTCENSNREWH